MRLPKVLAVTTALLAAGSAAAAASGAGHSAPGAVSSPVRISGTLDRSDRTLPPATAVRSAPSTSATTTPTSGGLAVPASGVPLASGLDPALPAQPSTASSSAPPVKLPTPTAGALPPVTPLGSVEEPDAVVMLPASVTAAEQHTLTGLAGVKAVETVDTGTVEMNGAPVVAFGVDPGSFRSFTPAASASSDQLWQYLAAGSLVSSYDMAQDRKLQLGAESTVIPAGATAATAAVQGWLGAFASIGLPGVDLLVASNYDSALNLTPDSGLVVSAPGVAPATLEQELRAALPGAAVEPLDSQVPSTVPGDTLASTVRQRIIAAALTRVGLPYVWGAAGPNQFDCSGLVQWSFRQAGVLMPRVAAEQFLTGDHIPLSDAQPGDLLFWTYDPSDPGYVDHVAIYLGNGLMVVAPHTGTDVQVTSVPTNDFAGAVEVVLRNS